MNVVWHQAIGVEVEGKLGFLPLEDADESEIVIVGSENLSSIVAASDDVIEPSGDFVLGSRGMVERSLSMLRIKCQQSEA